MLYFDTANAISIVIVVLSIICILIAYDMTRIASGAPRAWYVIISAFAVLFVSKSIQAYYDILSPTNEIAIEETLVTFAVLVLFVLGLFLLDRTFRGRMVASQDDSRAASERRTSRTSPSPGSSSTGLSPARPPAGPRAGLSR